MVERDADMKAETPEAHPEGRGRNPREQGMSASSATALRESSYLKASSVMEAVVERENMARAYRRVVSNRGSAGIDKMPVDDLLAHLETNWSRMKEELLEDRYRPVPVRIVEIEKPTGGKRTPGIPTVTDRLIQQALNQVLTPIFDPHFSESSYAFRPGR
ncbi:MAG: group II intron reverse transcriptase/maturase, partial [Bacteroidetes bacterium]|nr:group II intron reverse transcriptase/maturase [Bacteroidota bacterium]